MSSKKSGRTILIFLGLIVIILISGVAISLFLLQKETQARQTLEGSLEESRVRNSKVEAALKDAEKQIDVLKGKNKDADEKINNLLEELDLDAALREEIKAENKKLKDQLEIEGKSKVEMRTRLTAELTAVQSKLKEVEVKAEGSARESAEYGKKIEELQKKNAELENRLKTFREAPGPASRSEIVPVPGEPGNEKVDLDKIVINPESALEGKVLSVDTDTEFLIFSLGTKSGMKPGQVMSIYRGKQYLGDVKVSRVQDEMSAADFIPPFSSRKVRKNDLVVPKR